MKVYMVAFGFYDKPDRIFETRRKAEEYIEKQAEKRWADNHMRATSDRNKYLEGARSLYTIQEIEVL